MGGSKGNGNCTLPLLVAERGVGKEQHSIEASSSVVATELATGLDTVLTIRGSYLEKLVGNVRYSRWWPQTSGDPVHRAESLLTVPTATKRDFSWVPMDRVCLKHGAGLQNPAGGSHLINVYRPVVHLLS